jgi:putative SOS response-associated peptidase YedK
MCGRYVIRHDPQALAEWYKLEHSETPRDLQDIFRARFNIAPTQGVPIVREREIVRLGSAGQREIVMVRWGLIPIWVKDPSIGKPMINARAEGLEAKRSFSFALKKRRCIVPTSGFYEWARAGTTKQPYLVSMADGSPMGMAGLWERWRDPATGGMIESCAIITCGPNSLMAPLHDRMPVILDPADYDAWLRVGSTDLLRPCPSEWLRAEPVSTRVNNARNEGPELADPIIADLL